MKPGSRRTNKKVSDFECANKVSKKYCWGCTKKETCLIHDAYKRGRNETKKEYEYIEIDREIRLGNIDTVRHFARELKKQISPHIISHLMIDIVADQVIEGKKREEESEYEES